MIYKDLLNEIPNVSMEGYCERDYWKWERNHATPALEAKGYLIINWYTGERDSFGPLSRIALCEKDGNEIHFVYG